MTQHNPPAERIWIIYHFDTDPHTGELVRNDANVQTKMIEIGVLLSIIGGTITMATRRREVAPGHVLTIATVVRWRAFVPMEKAQEAPPAEQGIPGVPPTPPPADGAEILAVSDDPIPDPAPVEPPAVVTPEPAPAETPPAS